MEGNDQSNPVALALKTLHRTIEKTRFDPEDAILDLEALVKVAKVYNHDKAREYECVLDEIQKHAKNLPQKSLRDLLVALVGDPVKSKVLEKTNKLLKHMQPDHKSSPLKYGGDLTPVSLVTQALLVVVGASMRPDAVRHLTPPIVSAQACAIFVVLVSIC